MDMDNINAKANAGLTTGIIGTAGLGLGLLGQLFNSGGFGGMGSMLGGICAGLPGVMSQAVTRQEYEHNNSDIRLLAEKDAQIAELKMNTLMDSKVLDLYKYVEGNLHEINQKFADQAVWNATANGGMGSMAAQIASLQNTCATITKTVVPITAICPEPMARYNSWTAPTTVTTPAADTTA